MTVTRTPTQTRTPLPPKTTKAKKPPVRKLRNQVCEKPAGAAVNVLTLSCQPELYIQVTGTKYGRNGTVGDPKNKDGTCYQPGFRVTGECGNKPDSTFAQCNGYNSCQVPMNPSIVGPDLCASGTWKMLAADYDCLPADSFATVNDGTKLVTSKS